MSDKAKRMTAAQKAAARVPEPAPEPEVPSVGEGPSPQKARRTPKDRLKRAGTLVAALVLLCVLSFTLWTCNYSHEGDAARDALASTASVQVANESGWISFGDPTSSTGFVLYPGGKVAVEAYAPLLRQLADRGVFCVVVKMPFNLAFLGSDAADGVMAAYPQVGTWYIGGHSLGGVAACQWVAAHDDAVSGVVLLASYTADDLSGSRVRVLSVRGTNDQVMDLEAYERARALLPSDASEVVIEGGNHAQFGDYGEQAGDGQADIPAEEQRDQTVSAIESWMGVSG